VGRTQGKVWRIADVVLGSLGRGLAAALGVVGVALPGGGSHLLSTAS